MSEHCDFALRFAHEQRERILNRVKEFVSIPSISTDPSAQPEIKRAAEWVAERCGGWRWNTSPYTRRVVIRWFMQIGFWPAWKNPQFSFTVIMMSNPRNHLTYGNSGIYTDGAR